jgi:hypothetical protein
MEMVSQEEEDPSPIAEEFPEKRKNLPVAFWHHEDGCVTKHRLC